MYNNIGLKTARGSGTNGYVQRNFAAIPKHRQNLSWEEAIEKEEKQKSKKPVHNEANKEILDHEKKRKIEIAVLEWADSVGLLDSGMDQSEIDQKMDEKRQQILISISNSQFNSFHDRKQRPSSSSTSHEERQRKDEQQMRLGKALGVKHDYKEGSAFDHDYQEQEKEARRQRRVEMERLKAEEESILRQLDSARRSNNEQRTSRPLRDEEDYQSRRRRRGDGEEEEDRIRYSGEDGPMERRAATRDGDGQEWERISGNNALSSSDDSENEDRRKKRSRDSPASSDSSLSPPSPKRSRKE